VGQVLVGVAGCRASATRCYGCCGESIRQGVRTCLRRTALTKPEIAIEEIDRVITSETRLGCVLADPGYGSSGPFGQALSDRDLLWAVRLSRRQDVDPANVDLII
jgi:SRSO17 transposase